MKLNLSVDEALTTTRAVRRRIDFDRPVEPAVIKECLEIAIQSPNASNMQAWQWLVVMDPEQRAAIAEVYRKAWAIYEDMDINAINVYQGDDPDRKAQHARVMDSAEYLAKNFERVPALLVPLLPDRLDGLDNLMASSMLGSILPGVWSFMLAARERGLGTAWTSMHLMFEEETAEILGIDYSAWSQVAMITCGYSKGTEFRPCDRPAIETVLHWDRIGGEPPWS
jgi:nitroreductase